MKQSFVPRGQVSSSEVVSGQPSISVQRYDFCRYPNRTADKPIIAVVRGRQDRAPRSQFVFFFFCLSLGEIPRSLVRGLWATGRCWQCRIPRTEEVEGGEPIKVQDARATARHSGRVSRHFRRAEGVWAGDARPHEPAQSPSFGSSESG